METYNDPTPTLCYANQVSRAMKKEAKISIEDNFEEARTSKKESGS